MDVINLSRQDISKQLIDIAQRQFPLPGKRQVDFNKIEVLICYGLFYLINPHRYGGSNMHQAPAAVHSLASFFKRSPGSLINKMLNLDGSRKNSGKDEVYLFAQLAATPNLYQALYQEIMSVARNLQIGDDRFPDFLGLLEKQIQADTLLIGQEELPISSGQLLKNEQRVIREVQQNYALSDELTEKLVEQRVRLTQHRFAISVLTNCGQACVFCGFAPHTLAPKSGLLRASHIKPWSVSSNEERMDVRNGLAACPIHDAGFDQGYLTVTEAYTILRSPLLLQSIQADDPGVKTYFGTLLQLCLLLPSQSKKPDKQYLRYHQGYIFRHG